MILLEHRLAIYDHVVTLDRDNLARILIDEVLDPGRQDARCELATYGLLQVRLRHLYLIGQVEDLENLLVSLETDCTQQCRYGQLLLTVDVSIHHVVDIRGELDPRTLERDDTRRIELRTVRVHALAEEYTRRAVQLRNDHALGTIDDKRTTLGHVGNLAEVNVLYLHAEILVLVVRTVELQLRLEGYAVRQTALQTLLDRVAGRVNVVIDKLQNEVVPGVRDREVLLEDLVQPLVFTILGRRVHLEEVTERFELHLQQIGIRHPILHGGEARSCLFVRCGHRLLT